MSETEPVWQVVDDVAAAFVALLAERRPRSVALSGGETARRSYEAASLAVTDWSGSTFWFGDERWVPTESPDSNEGTARRVWLDRVTVAGVESMVGAAPKLETSDPGAAALDYETRLRAAPPIELVHLGLGADGHTASLFPDSPSLAVTDRWVIATGDDRHPHPRLTWTVPAIAAARLVVVTVAGAEKRAALRRVRDGDWSAPATRIHAAEVVWLVDGQAAG